MPIRGFYVCRSCRKERENKRGACVPAEPKFPLAKPSYYPTLDELDRWSQK